ncbi:MAG TPA: hypothetical protein VGI39_06810 [Polyangiaceae bacterium]|jgi:carbamoyltransferase
MAPEVVLGVSAFDGSSACCLMRDGAVVAAALEESFTRVAGDRSFPSRAIAHCLTAAGLGVRDVSGVAVACPGDQVAVALELLDRLGVRAPCERMDRATAHAAAAFLFSPSEEAAVLTIDAHGFASYFAGRGLELTLLGGFPEPAAAIRLLDVVGAKVAPGAGVFELLGLAEAGTDDWCARLAGMARYPASLRRLVHTLESKGQTSQTRADFARGAQSVAEAALANAAGHVRRATGGAQLCASLDAPLAELSSFLDETQGVFVPPATGSTAVALGAAGALHARRTGRRPTAGALETGVATAPRGADVQGLLEASSLVFSDYRNDESELLEAVTDRLVAGQVIAWHHGALEVASRVGEGRIVLVNPARRDYVARLEGVGERPGARRRSSTVQRTPPRPGQANVITPREGGRLARLLSCFEERTGCSHLAAVSLRAGDEPTAFSLEDSLRAFTRALIGTLVLEDFLVDRSHLPVAWAHRVANGERLAPARPRAADRPPPSTSRLRRSVCSYAK